MSDPQVQARGMVVEVGGVRQFGPPVKLSGHVPPTPSPAPGAGADTDALLSGLGLDIEEIRRLRDAGVI